MPWYSTVLLIALGVDLVANWYWVNRPRPTKTITEAVLATIELGLYAWVVVALAQAAA